MRWGRRSLTLVASLRLILGVHALPGQEYSLTLIGSLGILEVRALGWGRRSLTLVVLGVRALPG